MAAFRKILVPTDFTEASDRALEWAIELAARLSSSVTLMHAYEMPIAGFPEGALVTTPQTALQIADSARTALEAACARHRQRSVQIESVLREGVAWEEIHRVADELDADLIVLGSHGRRGLARALLGSVAEHVIRTSHRPVVTIPQNVAHH